MIPFASLRALARSRGFAAAVVATLAIAVALQTSVLAVVNAYMVRSLPYPSADRLYFVRYAQPPQNPPRDLETLDWASLADVVEHPIAWDLDAFYLLGNEYPERVQGAWITPGFVRGLDIRPAFGRTFNAEDFAPGAPQVALISDELWRSRFAADSGILGRTFSGYVSDRPADPETFTIVGVLPGNFWHVNPFTQVLTPLRADTYPYIVRLRDGVSAEQVARRIETLATDARLTVPDGWRVELRSLQADYVSGARPMLLAVGAAMALVMLIAIANVTLLMVLRGLRRRKEMAVRLALGAGRSSLARLLLSESVILVGTATAIGVALAAVVLRATAPLIELQLGRRVPGGPSAIAIDWPVLGVVLLSVLAVAIVISFAPLVGGIGFSALRERRGSGDAGSRRTRAALIALEVAGSVALLAGSGLMVRSVVALLDVDLGLTTERVVSSPIAVRDQSYPDADSRRRLYQRLLDEMTRTRGVASVALASPSPLVSYDPRPLQRGDSSRATESVSIRGVAGSYFDLMGVSVVQGRVFSDVDRGGGAPVAIISESAARRLFPGANPVGQTVRLTEEQLSNLDSVGPPRTVVGVVRDVRQSPMDLNVADAYVPILQTATRFTSIIARGDGAAPLGIATLRESVRRVDPEVAVGAVQQLDVAVAQQLARPRFLASLFAAFGIFAATLGVMGLYAVVAFAVKQREHEIAVRMAVGANARQIVALFLREGSLVVLAGVALGVFGAIGVGRLIRSQLFGVAPTDAATIAVVSLLLVGASVLAIWWPSRRASRASPVIALKAE